MRRAVLVVALLTLVAGTPVVDAQQTPAISAEGTTFVVQLQSDGDARWRVTTTYSLDTENETRAFRRYASAFEADEPVPGPDVTFFRRAAAQASEVADRQMTVRNVSRDATVGGTTGKLVLRFTWTNFLETGENETLVLADAFRTPDGGTWLRTLEPGQTLRVKTPPGYTIASTGNVSVTVRPNSFVVNGPQAFSNGGLLTVTYAPAPATAPPTTSPTPPVEDVPWDLVVGAVIVLVVAAVSALTWRRRTESEAAEPGTPSPPSEEPEPAEPPESEAEAPAAEGEEAAEEEELELLSDEERVERLLERNNGRMRQADIVKETDWSDAKVSQLLSKMADEGRVEKLRIGRENLISLPDYEADEE